MNQATRDTVDAFVTSVYGDINSAQNVYKLNNRDDLRYENGRYFNEQVSHTVTPADAANKVCTNRWTDNLLPYTMPCALRAAVLEYKNNMGWLLYINYIDDGTEYNKIIDTLDILTQDWTEVPNE